MTTKWMFLAIAVLATGMILKLGYWVYAAYVLLGTMLLSRFFARQWADGLAAFRSPLRDLESNEGATDSLTIAIGRRQTFSIQIENQSPFTIPWIIFEESIPRSARTPPKIKIQGNPLGILKLGAKESRFLEYTVTFRQRGYYQFGPLLLETGDLFGLHRRFRVVTEPQFILVLPKIIPLCGPPLASRRPVGEIQIAHRLFEDPTRIASVRPYHPGDPLNQIHWPATARTGELHSRVYENSCVAGAAFLLNFHKNAFNEPGSEASAELAVTTVASLANALFEEGRQIGLITNGRDAAERIQHEGWSGDFASRSQARQKIKQRQAKAPLRPLAVPPRKGAGQLARILETLGRLETADGLNFPELIQECANALPRDAGIVTVLQDASPKTALALGQLRRQGFAITILLIQFDQIHNPDWAQTPTWAKPLVAEGLHFIPIANEEQLAELSTADISYNYKT